MNAGVSREQIEHEARAKIFWGDEPESVIQFLQVNGIPFEDADAFVDSVLRERIANVRGAGIRKMVIGALMLTVPVIAFLTMGWLYRSFTVLTILGLAGAVGLWGAVKIFQGAFMLIFPENERGDLADEQD